ncbi:MAG: ferritin-like domain-containing protein [Candidatus Nanopelagicales bacterium]|nr:ferritin-like domain-containing protein [Candidatus Nanopelagicales bacterium]MDZ4250142.1 ferritin-like domain-containing protein [Candidatus Nanopelagicales bacterium]
MDAWAAAALGEEAAIYGYEVLTAQLVGAERIKALRAVKSHEHARDNARDRLTEGGGNLDAPAAYDLPFSITSPASAKRLAILLELRLVSVYASTVRPTDGSARAYAAASAQKCASRAVGWGWVPTAFPGMEADQPSGPADTSRSPVSDGARVD